MPSESHMSEMPKYLAQQVGLKILVRMVVDAAEWVGICYDLADNNPKKIEAIKRCDYLWKAITIKLEEEDA